MKLSDFATLAEAQAYSETTSKMISGSQMKIFVIENGLYGYFKNHTSDLQMATYDELQSGEFNFMKDHPSNVEALMDTMIAGDNANATALTNLKTACVAYANSTTFPFASATQAEFDQAKLEASLVGTQAATSVTIQGNIPHYVCLPNKRTRFYIYMDSPAPCDVHINVYIHGCPNTLDPSVDANFNKDPRPALVIKVPQGETSANLVFQKPLPRWCRFSAEADKLVSFTANVEQDV